MSRFNRAELIFGDDLMAQIMQKKVILFGVGGVGSWCAESLVRTGVHNLTIVDFDKVAESNINRQLPATTSTVGRYKVEVLRERLIDINPDATITIINKAYDETTANEYDFNTFDYVIDAIDSLDCKMLLIRSVCQSKAKLFSSMGAALKLDPTRVAVAEFWKVIGCPLAASLRRRFKKSGILPKKKFKCVYSEELLKNKMTIDAYQASETNGKANGSLAHITGIFGFTLAGLVFQDIVDKYEKSAIMP